MIVNSPCDNGFARRLIFPVFSTTTNISPLVNTTRCETQHFRGKLQDKAMRPLMAHEGGAHSRNVKIET